MIPKASQNRSEPMLSHLIHACYIQNTNMSFLHTPLQRNDVFACMDKLKITSNTSKTLCLILHGKNIWTYLCERPKKVPKTIQNGRSFAVESGVGTVPGYLPGCNSKSKDRLDPISTTCGRILDPTWITLGPKNRLQSAFMPARPPELIS